MSVRFRTGSKTWTPRALALAGSLLIGLALAGCGARVQVTIVNASAEPLTELRVVGEVDSTRVEPIAPGARASVRAAVKGEDAIVLRGRVGGRPLTPMMSVYVEGGYRVWLVVDATGSVGVREHVGLAKY